MRSTEPRRSSLELLTPHLPVTERGERIEDLFVSAIRPNARQVRKKFDESKIQELAKSIESNTLLAPVIVRRISKSPVTGLFDGGVEFELIAGERRWRAYKLLGKDKIPAIVRDIDDSQMRLLALIENVQREDLSVTEKAQSMLDLKAEFGSIEKVVIAIHKSRSYGFTLARIGELDEEYKSLIDSQDLGMDVADKLAGLLKDAEKSGNERTEGAVKRAILENPVTEEGLAKIRTRFLGQSEKKSSKPSNRDSSQKYFWKSKRAIGLEITMQINQIQDIHSRNQAVKEAKRFFEAIGARKIDIAF